MSDVRTLFGKLKDLTDTETLAPEIVQQFDTIEGENLRIMIDISDHIREIDRENSATKLHRSSRSSRSHSTRISMHSNASKRSDVAIEAATLMSKLKFMDLEAKSKVEL